VEFDFEVAGMAFREFQIKANREIQFKYDQTGFPGLVGVFPEHQIMVFSSDYTMWFFKIGWRGVQLNGCKITTK
jgi:hypothetical protein